MNLKYFTLDFLRNFNLMKKKKLVENVKNRPKTFIRKSKYIPKTRQINNKIINPSQPILMYPLNENNDFISFLKKNNTINNVNDFK